MKQVTIAHSGFHGSHTATIRPRQAVDLGDDQRDIPAYIVSRRVGERLNRLACGIADCTCSSVWATPWSDVLGAYAPWDDDYTEMVVSA